MIRMQDKLVQMEEEYERLGKLLSDPAVIADRTRYEEYTRSYNHLQEVVFLFRECQKIGKEIEDSEDLLLRGDEDKEFLSLVRNELVGLKEKREKLEKELEALISPESGDEKRNTIIEIRAGAGGNEASLFASDLFRMYSRYAERRGWKLEVMNSHPTGLGGFKEIIFGVEGSDSYHRLRFEGGVHRVQRIPVTESGGRIHTSTVTVAVLPEAEEVEVQIDPNDLRIDTFRSSGPGGQHVNVTDSAVRVTHLPTGIVVQCQDEKSQHKNKAKAIRVLRARLFNYLREKKLAQISQERKLQVGSGDRSQKIRTYNFPQNRVTDHRIGLTLHRLEEIMRGDLDDLIEVLSVAESKSSD